jgi:hypothetical protein
MPQEPLNHFGWLLNCCINDDASKRSGDAFSAAALLASGMVASGLTVYFAGMLHLI